MSYDTTTPYPNWPVQPPTPPAPAARRRRPPLWLLILAGVVAVALIIGLVIWAPWSPKPAPPTAVHVESPTATTALVSWVMPASGATPDSFVILRDGKRAGVVPAAETSWTDTGLAPGSKHTYAVETVGGGAQSGMSLTQPTVTTLTPAPVGLTVAAKTWTSLRIHWSPSPKGPAADQYTIYNGTTKLGTVPGSTTSYDVANLQPGQDYQYSVTATWNTAVSEPSDSLDATTTAAPLSGSVPVHVRTTSAPGAVNLKVGDSWDDTWQFSPTCSTTSCSMSVSAEFAPQGSPPKPFTVKLTGSGGSYSGTTTARITLCGSALNHNTITLNMSAKASSNGGWTAWTGTFVLGLPYTQPDSTHFCSAENWDFAVTGTHS